MQHPSFSAVVALNPVSRLHSHSKPDGGLTTKTRAFEFRVGGERGFVMHGPDGTDYPEWISWTEIAPPERIALQERASLEIEEISS